METKEKVKKIEEIQKRIDVMESNLREVDKYMGMEQFHLWGDKESIVPIPDNLKPELSSYLSSFREKIVSHYKEKIKKLEEEIEKLFL